MPKSPGNPRKPFSPLTSEQVPQKGSIKGAQSERDGEGRRRERRGKKDGRKGRGEERKGERREKEKGRKGGGEGERVHCTDAPPLTRAASQRSSVRMFAHLHAETCQKPLCWNSSVAVHLCPRLQIDIRIQTSPCWHVHVVLNMIFSVNARSFKSSDIPTWLRSSSRQILFSQSRSHPFTALPHSAALECGSDPHPDFI